MKALATCEGQPGCQNLGLHEIRGYYLCLRCFRALNEYSPPKAAIITAYGVAYRAWQHNQASDEQLRVAERDARQAGATDLEIRAAEAQRAFRQEPAP